MQAYAQVLTAVVRSGPIATKWKKPYEVSTTISAVDPLTAWAHTVWREDAKATPRITREHIVAMSLAAFRLGFTRCKWIRFRNGRRRTIIIKKRKDHNND